MIDPTTPSRSGPLIVPTCASFVRAVERSTSPPSKYSNVFAATETCRPASSGCDAVVAGVAVMPR